MTLYAITHNGEIVTYHINRCESLPSYISLDCIDAIAVLPEKSDDIYSIDIINNKDGSIIRRIRTDLDFNQYKGLIIDMIEMNENRLLSYYYENEDYQAIFENTYVSDCVGDKIIISHGYSFSNTDEVFIKKLNSDDESIDIYTDSITINSANRKVTIISAKDVITNN